MWSKSRQNISYPFCPLPLILFLLLTQSCTSASPSPQNTFDFVIIGGGTAGLCVARRLAEDTKFTVLVLESGDVPKGGSEIPAFAPMFVSDPEVTFRYHPIPQKNAGLRNNGTMTIISGRMLSGTSNLNYMNYNRGSPRDYDNWGNLTQDTSWNYSSMLKYFKRAENYRGDHPSDQHGFNGPLTISRNKYAPGLNIWLEAGKSLGYEIADPNGPQRISFSAIEHTKRRGRRVNSFDGYVNPILQTSPNLLIFLNTNATKILFENNRAVGVCVQSTSPLLRYLPGNCVYARNEIILSAGTYGSPQLLLRSGIGPKDSLLKANIPVIKDLPVGLNFQDHVFINVPFILNAQTLVMDNDRDLNPGTFEVYETVGDGPYTNALGTTGQFFMASSVAKSEGQSDWGDLQIVMAHSKQAFLGTATARNDSFNTWEGPMAVSIFLTRPKSRGNLTLDPDNPDGPPVIDLGLFTDPRDIQIMLDGINEVMKVFEETPAYKRVGARFPEKLNLPWCSEFSFRSREFWECYIRYTSIVGCHPVGTCKMGQRSSGDAVVDSKLRVFGIENLRVVDASIIPAVPNINTQGPVYGIAEKASEMILEDWGY